MADISAYNTEEPAFYDFFGGDSGIYDVIRKLKIAFEERLSLDHYFDVDLTTTDPECDGYHTHVTMYPFSGISSTTGQEILDPEEIDDGVILYCKTIDGKPELCIRDHEGCFQISNDGNSGYISLIQSYGGNVTKCIRSENVILLYGTDIYASLNNGITFIKIYTAASVTYAAYGNGKFVLCTAYSGTIFTIDEATLSISTYAIPYIAFIQGLVYGNGYFVIAAYSTCNGTTSMVNPYAVCSTGNNIWSWVRMFQNTWSAGLLVWQIAFINPYFVATLMINGNPNKTLYIVRSSTPYQQYWSCTTKINVINCDYLISAGNYLFLAYDTDYPALISTIEKSSDGLTWSGIGASGYSSNFKIYFYENEYFMLFASGIQTSPDAQTWTTKMLGTKIFGIFYSEWDEYFYFTSDDYCLYKTKDFLTTEKVLEQFISSFSNNGNIIITNKRMLLALEASAYMTIFGYPKLD